MQKITVPTWAEINLDNLRFNLNNIKNLLEEDIKICGVIKADAYGHGAVEVAKLLEKEKVDYLAVARTAEGIELRQNGITLPILNLGYTPDEAFEDSIKNKITMTVYSLETAQKINEIAKSLGEKACVHVKIDSGMTRIGFQPNEESVQEIIELNKLEYIDLEGMFTHFATADEVSKEYTYKQANNYKFMSDKLDEAGVKIAIKHVSNSAAIMDCPDLRLNMVRAGIILYGHYPSDDVFKDRLELRPAMKLKSKIGHIKQVEPGVGISYGLKYTTTGKETIATVPIGYADGFTRIQKNPKVLIKGEVFDVVGRICMDQIMVRIDKDIDIKVGDEVILFGEGEVTAERIAKDLGTINYEVLCMISRRVDRVYMENNELVQINSYLLK
ncbi:TPA: alanine racemase [Clostridioides difficile]|uniref:Alanine racemase n=9 Tax=Bacillota TaxID=1239 RepID=Q180W0_CLOD6|nr:alanine racemase [Clostridioides difficile]4LUT_A Chain A, Alanine racemase [Clostridioides difficile 630]EQG58109.1 alanine racemase [Clostridioides difficile DA00149]EQI26985.1 alanine racemase [Clostridioides difficile Y184]EQK79642.1 alanine racemase [Clostridioides difficile CD127]OFT98815.1 alanine racemase [Clostridium sp. HMSC19E03]OFU04324.1 alanine racemase [Clostridium sp. HMSC19D07]OFU10507.1 alanine racemase [Clostridium sp. HMSC19C11]OFU15039.1 alanine racemase [Clostridium